jgi:hypothetical protein
MIMVVVMVMMMVMIMVIVMVTEHTRGITPELQRAYLLEVQNALISFIEAGCQLDHDVALL